MQITKEKLLTLWGFLNSLGNTKAPVKFSYGIVRNKQGLKPEVDAIELVIAEARERVAGLAEFDQERIEICTKWATPEGEVEPVTRIVGNGKEFVIPEEKKEEFNAEIETLREKYKKELEEKDLVDEEIQDLLKETVEFNEFKISLEFCPPTFSPNEIELLGEILKD